MFYQSSKHHFDTMFVILCLIARATSNSVSNTSKTPINQLNNHHRTSFIDFILDADLQELVKSSTTLNEDLVDDYSSNYKPTKLNQRSQTSCALLSNLLTSNQMKLCLKHQDVLKIVLPQVVQLTKKECIKIAANIRWNCTGIDFLLDRSHSLAFTREAALVRSILNASMMYLIVKTCSESNYRSCGCQNNQRYPTATIAPIRTIRSAYQFSIEEEHEYTAPPNDRQDLSSSDLSKLDAGLPLRLTKSIIRRQGCSTNTAFANALTKLFIDSDDAKTLDKAYRILNEDHNYNWLGNKSLKLKRLLHSDRKDLAYIKWTKSAVNLHNNNVGRQMMREATQRRCRCHGISGLCQFQTCWDQLLDFGVISSRLKLIYLAGANKVEVMNLGSFEEPDLYLKRVRKQLPGPSKNELLEHLEYTDSKISSSLLVNLSAIPAAQMPDRFTSRELLYLYESPEYCDAQPKIGFPGTRGRACTPFNDMIAAKNTSKKTSKNSLVTEEFEYGDMEPNSPKSAPGSCELICCNRGYRSELVLDMVACNCRFNFCCKVECEHCLQQRVKHYCL